MYVIYFLLLFAGLVFGQNTGISKSDYWIIENPSALVIYNQYEQRLSEPEKKQLPGYSAWQILDVEHLLSDQFTFTIKTDLNRRIFYIQLTDQKEAVNKHLAGVIEVVKNARLLGDTIRVITDDRLSLRRGTIKILLSEGVLIERLFTHRKKTFGRDLTNNLFGWIEGNLSRNSEPYIPDNTDLAIEKQLFSRVDQIFTSQNNRFDKLFSVLNTEFESSKPSPFWDADISPAILKYTLTPSMYTDSFTDSQSYLVQELSDLLYGSAYQLSASNGQILIFKSSN